MIDSEEVERLVKVARNTDKLQHGYLPHYAHHLSSQKIDVLVEIGVNRAGSLHMWRDWLPEAQIIGLDIEPTCAAYNEERVRVIIADATEFEPDFSYDVVIDDGSHEGDDQLAAFQNFWPKLNPGGWYVIEDLETAWHPGFRDGEAITKLLHWVLDDALLGKTPSASPQSYSVGEVHAYEQIIFLRKAKA